MKSWMNELGEEKANKFPLKTIHHAEDLAEESQQKITYN